MRANDKTFSFRAVSLEAGLHSPNYIQKFISGVRQFKVSTASEVGRAYGLSDNELEFFLLLLRFNQARRVEDRRRWYRDLLCKAVENGAGQLDYARLEYFSHWYVSAIHAMASLEGFVCDAGKISKIIVPSIRKNEAQRALDILVELGILDINADGSFLLNEPQLETSPDVQSVWIREYHRAMIALANGSIERWDKEHRNTSAITVTVKKDQVTWLIDRIDRFRNELFAELMGSQAKDDQVDGEVFQINLQAFPLTAFSIQPAHHVLEKESSI